MIGSSNIAKAREDVLLFCHRMMAEQLVYFTAGNISCRVIGSPELIAITPSAIPYDTLVLDEIPIVNIKGDIEEGSTKPTSELPLHTLIYQNRPDVNAVVHTHSIAGMTMAVLGATLPPILTGLVSAAGGSVVTAPFARGGTDEMAKFTTEALKDRSACFLRNHGVLAIGPTFDQAYNAAVTVEASAKTYLQAKANGEMHELPVDEIERIHEIWKSRWER